MRGAQLLQLTKRLRFVRHKWEMGPSLGPLAALQSLSESTSLNQLPLRLFHASSPHHGMIPSLVSKWEQAFHDPVDMPWSQIHVRRLFKPPPATVYDERKLIGYSPDQIFKVVSQVEDYYKFVPWCVKSTVVKRNPTNYIECDLEVGFQLFVERYTSKIRLSPPTSLTTVTEDSTLFHHLESLWKFEKGPTPDSCWLSFHVDFAFKSPLYKHVASVFFEEVVKRMISAFISRCEVLYGPSSLSAPSRPNKSVRLA